LRIIYDVAVENNSEVTTLSNYSIPGLTITSAFLVSDLQDHVIELGVSEMLGGGAYSITISNNIESTTAEPLGGVFAFHGEGGDPIIEILPRNGEKLLPNDHVRVTVTDHDSGVDLNSVIIQIGSDIAFQNQVFQSGYNGPESSAVTKVGGAIYKVVVDITKVISFGPLNILVTAKDNAGN